MHLVSLFKLSCGRVLLAGTLCLCGSACVAQTQLALATVAATSPLRAKVSPAAAAAEVAALPDAPVSQIVHSQSVDVTQTAPPASQTPANAPATQQQQEQLSREEQAARDVKAQEHQRILGIMPAFNSTSNQNAVPLTASQKIQLSFRSAVDPWQFGITVVASALGQAENSHPGYGQGWEGYGKRYAASYGDLFDGTIIGNGLLPALLHQDPRYFRKGTGSKWHRFFYAASTNIICKGDNGKWQPNYSNVGGNLISGGISEFYYPKQEQDVGLLFSNAATVTLEGAIGSELLEFWPDIHRKLFKNKTDSYTQAADEAQKKGGATPPATPKQQVQPAEPK
jgi:hypothetical protein